MDAPVVLPLILFGVSVLANAMLTSSTLPPQPLELKLTSMNLKEVDTLRVGGEDLEFDFTPPASPSKQSGSGFLMPRSESEYSLGLNRSDSVAENIMELGTMCDAGLTVVMVGRVLFFSTAIVWAGSWLNSKGKSSTS